MLPTVDHATIMVMTAITVQIPDPTAQRLREQAERAGKPLSQLVEEILAAQSLKPTSLAEISGDSAERFRATGMTEDELAEELEREDHASRGVPYDD